MVLRHDVAEPVVPEYRGACLSALLPALRAPAGRRPGWLPDAATGAAQVVLLVLDGLGWDQLRARPAAAPVLSAMPGGQITSVCPTTTATALTSITLGAPPCDHGLVGYRFRIDTDHGEEVINALRWRTASGDARQSFPPAGAVHGTPFAGRPVPVVSKAEFAGTGFSVAHQRGAVAVGWTMPSAITIEVARLLGAGEPLVYVYYEGIDKVAHATGLGAHYDAELAAADRLVADLTEVLVPGSALLVTADHGQVEVGERAVPLDAEVLGHTRLVSGEARFRWLHARPGAEARLLDAARAHYGIDAWVRTVDEVVDAGWFGGALTDPVRRRLGDVAVVPHAPVAYLEPGEGGDARLVCRHGSLTAAEMLVPLVGVAGPGSG